MKRVVTIEEGTRIVNMMIGECQENVPKVAVAVEVEVMIEIAMREIGIVIAMRRITLIELVEIISQAMVGSLPLSSIALLNSSFPLWSILSPHILTGAGGAGAGDGNRESNQNYWKNSEKVIPTSTVVVKGLPPRTTEPTVRMMKPLVSSHCCS